MHTLTIRKPTPEEQQTIAARAKPDFASVGCLVIFVAGPAWLLGKLGHWLGGMITPEAAKYAQWIGWAITFAVYTPFVVSIFRYGRRQRKLAQSDHEDQLVQEIHVTNARLVEVAMVGNIGPNLAIELNSESVLYLQGQWLSDNSVYNAPIPENDDGDEKFNGLPSPHAFPSTEFTLIRLPNSGEVLQIQVSGEYVHQEPAVKALQQHHRFQPSEIFSGQVADIAQIMEREHASRQRRL